MTCISLSEPYDVQLSREGLAVQPLFFPMSLELVGTIVVSCSDSSKLLGIFTIVNCFKPFFEI